MPLIIASKNFPFYLAVSVKYSTFASAFSVKPNNKAYDRPK